MGGFANSALNLMLGWVRGTAQWVWQLVSGGSGDSAMTWLSQHWLTLVIGLCVAGMVIDFMVYLARWRPDLVWRSFIRRVTRKKAPQSMLERELAAPPMADNAEPAQDDASAQADAQPVQTSPRQRHRRSEKYGEGTRYAKLMKVKEVLFPEEQEVTFQSYKPSKPLGNQGEEQEQNKPYIPPQWQKPEE